MRLEMEHKITEETKVPGEEIIRDKGDKQRI